MQDCQVFISYRREGGTYAAGRLFDRLSTMGYRVFYDHKQMHEGRFEDQILQAIDSSTDVLVLLPPNGLDRCNGTEKDYVREEIAFALKKNKNVIPIRMPDFKFPEKLPDDIEKIKDLHSPALSDEYYDSFIELVVKMLHSKPEDTSKIDQLMQDITNGQRFISHRIYDKAMECLDRAMQVEPANPEAYFLAAVALLQGKRPFLADRASANRAVDYLKVAISTGSNPIYSYFMAYIKYDHHTSKGWKTIPPYQAHLADAIAGGVTQESIEQLFRLLGTKKPECF